MQRAAEQEHMTDQHDELAFGQWLKQRRRSLDLTQDGLAQKTNCSTATIKKIEAGDLVPSKQLAELLASPELRQALLQLQPYKPEPVDAELRLIEQSSAKRKPQYLHTCLDTLCDLADAIEQVQLAPSATIGITNAPRSVHT